MKKITLILAVLCLTFSATAQTVTVNPDPFIEDQMMTITISDFDPVATWGTSDIYLWSWIENGPNFANNGDWQNSNEAAKFTYNSMDNTYTLSYIPIDSYGDNVTEIGTLNIKLKTKTGSEESGTYPKQSARFLNVSDFEKEDAGFSLYPTLATNVINFTADVQEVIVFNTAGVIVKSFTGDYRAGAGFDINELTSGLYIVQATNKKGIFGSFKMIK